MSNAEACQGSLTVTHGVQALNRLLQEQTFDLRTLDVAAFRSWLERHLTHWQADPVFVQRGRIRDLRRANPRLRELEEAQRRASVAEADSPQAARLRELDRELLGTDQALAGLAASLEDASPENHSALQTKWTAFRTRRQQLEQEQAELRRSSDAWQRLQQASINLQQLRSATGIDGEETRLEELMLQRGRHSGRAGESYEEVALGVTRACLLPNLTQGGCDGVDRQLRLLQDVTLGAARIQLDQVVVRLPLQADGPVEALAVIEAKRNLNDLGHGFRLRQENLAWLSGATNNYDPELYRTRQFRFGHFDCSAVHEEKGETFRFDRSSFDRFRPESVGGPILDGLYFITQSGPVWGVSAGNLARISHRVATDERWAPDSDDFLGAFLSWCQSLTEATETPDVLRLYANAPGRAHQILLTATNTQ